MLVKIASFLRCVCVASFACSAAVDKGQKFKPRSEVGRQNGIIYIKVHEATPFFNLSPNVMYTGSKQSADGPLLSRHGSC